jgi:hypothetical protein
MVDQARRDLAEIFGASDFLADYRLLVVTETRADSIQRLVTYHYRDLSGDTTLPPTGAGQTNRLDLEAGSLYLRDRSGLLHLFRPLLHYLECPECHLMSTFYLDRYDGSPSVAAVHLKSFERNSVRTEMSAGAFSEAGLLPALHI